MANEQPGEGAWETLAVVSVGGSWEELDLARAQPAVKPWGPEASVPKWAPACDSRAVGLTQEELDSLQRLSQEEALLPVVVVGVTAVHVLDPREAGFCPAVFLQGLEEGSSLSVGKRTWWLELRCPQVHLGWGPATSFFPGSVCPHRLRSR